MEMQVTLTGSKPVSDVFQGWYGLIVCVTPIVAVLLYYLIPHRLWWSTGFGRRVWHAHPMRASFSILHDMIDACIVDDDLVPGVPRNSVMPGRIPNTANRSFMSMDVRMSTSEHIYTRTLHQDPAGARGRRTEQLFTHMKQHVSRSSFPPIYCKYQHRDSSLTIPFNTVYIS